MKHEMIQLVIVAVKHVYQKMHIDNVAEKQIHQLTILLTLPEILNSGISAKSGKFELVPIYPYSISTLVCDAATTCSGQGTCTNEGSCTCNEGFSGADCSTPGKQINPIRTPISNFSYPIFHSL